jgi:hypothetical protein
MCEEGPRPQPEPPDEEDDSRYYTSDHSKDPPLRDYIVR